MPLNPRPDDPIRAALGPFRVDPARFEAGVRARLASPDFARDADPLAGLSPWLRAAAAFLPLPLIAGCRVPGPAASAAPAAGGFKIMSYLAFPAISLFVLLAATVVGVARIRGIQDRNRPAGDQEAINEAMRLWWQQHRWGAIVVYAAALSLTVLQSWLLFAACIISVGVLVLVLASLARLGLGDRHRVGWGCMYGLGMLWMVTSGPGPGDDDLHFLDQNLIPLVIAIGAILACALGASGRRFGGRAGWIAVDADLVLSLILAATFLPMGLFRLAPALRPITPAQIRAEVESFEAAPHSSASWQQWGIVARWAVEAGLRPDLAKPRRLLDRPGEDGADPFVLGAALQAGLDPPGRPDVAEKYAGDRKDLLVISPYTPGPGAISSVEQAEWVIRAAARAGSLSVADRDLLERRLHATIAVLKDETYQVLARTLLVTRLLGEIGRPAPPERYRAQVHACLVRHHSRVGGGFQRAGGFRAYLDGDNPGTGDAETTEVAIELMGIYGVPAGLDLNWVRSYIRPTDRAIMNRWVLAVARARLDRLPDSGQPTWWDWIYYERSLAAAVILVALCCFAVRTSPRRPEAGSELVGRDDLAAGAGGEGPPGGEAD